jgi:hypothetical protein
MIGTVASGAKIKPGEALYREACRCARTVAGGAIGREPPMPARWRAAPASSPASPAGAIGSSWRPECYAGTLGLRASGAALAMKRQECFPTV